MTDVELSERELSLLINIIQNKETLDKEETALLKKLSDQYKEAIETSPPPE